MQTIKDIVFIACVLVAVVSGFLLLSTLATVEVSSILGLFLWVLVNAVICGASSLAVKYLYERWYKK